MRTRSLSEYLLFGDADTPDRRSEAVWIAKSRQIEVLRHAPRLLLIALFCGCTAKPPGETAGAGTSAAHTGLGTHVSLYDLMDDPSVYAGMTVQVHGYLSLGFEDNTLCAEYEASANAKEVWVSMRRIDGMRDDLLHAGWSFGLVLVEGTVSTDRPMATACTLDDATIMLVFREKGVPSVTDDFVYQDIELLYSDSEEVRRKARSRLVEATGKALADYAEWSNWWIDERQPGLSREAYNVREAFFFSEEPTTEIKWPKWARPRSAAARRSGGGTD